MKLTFCLDQHHIKSCIGVNSSKKQQELNHMVWFAMWWDSMEGVSHTLCLSLH